MQKIITRTKGPRTNARRGPGQEEDIYQETYKRERHDGRMNRTSREQTDNEKDIEDIPISVRKGIEIITVGEADQVLREALVVEGHDHFQELLQEKSARFEELFGKDKIAAVPGATEDKQGSGITTH